MQTITEKPLLSSVQELALLERRLSLVQGKILGFCQKSNINKIRYPTFNKIISPHFFREEAALVRKQLEARGFLRDSGCYLYLLSPHGVQDNDSTKNDFTKKTEVMLHG